MSSALPVHATAALAPVAFLLYAARHAPGEESAVLQAQGLVKRFGAFEVLRRASLQVGRGEKVGLIGRNGSGKSTLLRLLAGVEQADAGHVTRTPSDLVVATLPQAATFEPGTTVTDALRPDPTGDLPPEWERDRVLAGLGLAHLGVDQLARTLSGGEKTRLMLARVLLSDADLLLLDEPTNHLDLEMLAWLERFVRTSRRPFLLVSHDRRFLDRTVDRLYELDSGRLVPYAGGYSAYAEQKELALRRHETLYREQQREISALQEFIRRQLSRSASIQQGPKRGRDHYGRISEKVGRQAKAAQSRLDRIERLDRPRAAAAIQAGFSPRERSGQWVIEARGIAARFDQRPLFEGFDLDVLYGERWGIIGPNGSGKTTLLRHLLGLAAPAAGHITPGASLRTVYLAQEGENLDRERTVLEELQAGSALTHTEARTLLACVLFRQDDVFKRVGSISAGERVRLALAKAMVSGANLMVLDEPTNHLDIAARERMEEALAAYEGTLLVVSHDRHLLDRLVDRLVLLGDGKAERFLGGYSEWEGTADRKGKTPTV
jgi:ATP-binding cassette subfamily F protein 3